MSEHRQRAPQEPRGMAKVVAWRNMPLANRLSQFGSLSISTRSGCILSFFQKTEQPKDDLIRARSRLLLLSDNQEGGADPGYDERAGEKYQSGITHLTGNR